MHLADIIVHVFHRSCVACHLMLLIDLHTCQQLRFTGLGAYTKSIYQTKITRVLINHKRNHN